MTAVVIVVKHVSEKSRLLFPKDPGSEPRTRKGCPQSPGKMKPKAAHSRNDEGEPPRTTPREPADDVAGVQAALKQSSNEIRDALEQ